VKNKITFVGIKDKLIFIVPAGSVRDDPALPLWKPKARPGN